MTTMTISACFSWAHSEGSNKFAKCYLNYICIGLCKIQCLIMAAAAAATGLRLRVKGRLNPTQALEKNALYRMVSDSIENAWRSTNAGMRVCDIDDAQVFDGNLVVTVSSVYHWESGSLFRELRSRHVALPQLSVDNSTTRTSALVLRVPMKTFGDEEEVVEHHHRRDNDDNSSTCGCLFFVVAAIALFCALMMLSGQLANNGYREETTKVDSPSSDSSTPPPQWTTEPPPTGPASGDVPQSSHPPTGDTLPPAPSTAEPHRPEAEAVVA